MCRLEPDSSQLGTHSRRDVPRKTCQVLFVSRYTATNPARASRKSARFYEIADKVL